MRRRRPGSVRSKSPPPSNGKHPHVKIPDGDFDIWDLMLEFCEDAKNAKRMHNLTEGKRAMNAAISIAKLKLRRIDRD